MAGFDNDTVYGNNADFSRAGSNGGEATNGLQLDGQLWIGRTSVNAGGTHIDVATLTPGVGTTITNAAGSITIGANGNVATTYNADAGSAAPTGNILNVLGSGSTTTTGAGNTVTTVLTGLTNHSVLVGAGTATITKVGPTATAGQVLQSAGAAADPAFSTATYPATTTINQVLYSSAANTVDGITAANNGTMISGTTGVPSWLANGTTGQVLTATTGSPPSWVANAAASAFTSIVVQTFTATGTYTPTSGMKYCIIECVGAGGGGGGTSTTGATTISVGGGGGGGAYCRKFASAATIGASQTVTIGAAGTAGAVGGGNGGTGGTTSVGTLCIAIGGSGGLGSAAVTAALFLVSGNIGGIGTTGDVQAIGNPGTPGMGSSTSNFVAGGNGGSSALGGAPLGTIGSLSAAGAAGGNYGGGGAGAVCGTSQTQQLGGAGAKGFVIVTEYI